ncbi:hypothetical protein UC34_25480 [Pandoraea vervacti]|uniref:NEL domain-containing protein n=1 Tax=Pandoraea vervacti TaxID=656178 RepID=A0ABM6FRM1_9BURK|nr:NEL-type E3 ubiquitin ligase domain-containing protein [Pandoraea vervacti]APD11439.1 hypothetical protein UC34_25480 [Pandoraea vervacti]
MPSISPFVSAAPLTVPPIDTVTTHHDAGVDAAVDRSLDPPGLPWPTIAHDVLACLSAQTGTVQATLANASVVGCAMALGGQFSGWLRWGTQSAPARDATFRKAVAELRLAGVSQEVIDKLANINDDAVAQAALFRQFFPEISDRAMLAWLRHRDHLDPQRHIDFSRFAIALRGRLNAAPLTAPDEVLRALQVDELLRALGCDACRASDSRRADGPMSLSRAIRDMSAWLRGSRPDALVDAPPAPPRRCEPGRCDVFGADATLHWPDKASEKKKVWKTLMREGFSPEQALAALRVFRFDRAAAEYLDNFVCAAPVSDATRRWIARERWLTGFTSELALKFVRDAARLKARVAGALENTALFGPPLAGGFRLASFHLDPSGPKARRLAQAFVLERQAPAWAFDHVSPSSVLKWYGPDRVPADTKRIHVLGRAGRLVLPEHMPNLESLTIEGDLDITLPKWMPRLRSFHIKCVRLGDTVELPAMPALKTLLIYGADMTALRLHGECAALDEIRIYGNPSLRSVVFEPGADDMSPNERHSPLRTITVRENVRLRHIALPLDLRACERIDLTHNDLTRVPLGPAHRVDNLRRLYLAKNRLSTLSDLPEMPRIDFVSLIANEFRHVPNWVLRLPPSRGGGPAGAAGVMVNIEDNPIPEAMVREIMTLAQRERCALIFFSIWCGEHVPVRALPDAVADWFELKDQPARAAAWAKFSNEDCAEEFSAFLDYLRRTVNYGSQTFREGVGQWLMRLEGDDALRGDTLPHSYGSTRRCEDRVTWAYEQMRQRALCADIARGDYDDDLPALKALMQGCYRRSVLAQIAYEKARTLKFVDEIEVYLAYQIKLRNVLGLPLDAEDMRFFGAAGVTEEDLSNATVRVLREEREALAPYLSNAAPVQAALRRALPQAFAVAEAKLQAMSDVDAFNALVKTSLQQRRLEVNDTMIREAGRSVLHDLVHDCYGPLVKELLGSV